ncbi:MAG TPA: hypothetical protein VIG24_03060 [Acidimicrobiia bacterium]
MLDDLRDIVNAATPGPWEAYSTDLSGDWCVSIRTDLPTDHAHIFSTEWADAEFIAAARNALPALLDLRDAARDAPQTCQRYQWVDAGGGIRRAVDCGECWACRIRAALAALEDNRE